MINARFACFKCTKYSEDVNQMDWRLYTHNRITTMKYSLILPASAFVFAFLVLGTSAPQAQAANVVETAQSVDELSTLVELVVAAGLADTLAEADDITVFAPTDEAFEKLPALLMRAIAADEDNSILTAILTYHVAPERLRAEDVVAKRSIETLQGSSIRVRTAGPTVLLDTSRVTAVDIETDNATVHTIDRVLIPWRDILRDVIATIRSTH